MRMAEKKEGALIPSTLPPTTMRSNAPPGFRAATIPIGIPKIKAKQSDTKASSTVAGRASINKASTLAGLT